MFHRINVIYDAIHRKGIEGELVKTGVISGISAADYFAIPAINKSGLDAVARSPLHYWTEYLAENREPRRETPAMRLGTAIHCAALEPIRFAKLYREAPRPEMFPGALVTLEDYKKICSDLYLPVSGTKEVLKRRIQEASTTIRFFDDIQREYDRYLLLSADDFQTCVTISSQLRTNAGAYTLFEEGQAEQTILWKHPEHGVFCKARADWITSDGWIVDLKSSEDARPEAFSRSAYGYGYHRQAAWYLQGYEAALKKKARGFIFAVFEKQPPYACAFYMADPSMIEAGRKDIESLIKVYADAKATGVWKGYPEEILPLALPAWVSTRQKEATLTEAY